MLSATFSLKYAVSFTWLLLFTVCATPAAEAFIRETQDLLSTYETAKPILDNPTPEQPFYLHAEIKKYVQSGEAALYFDESIEHVAASLGSLGNWCRILLLHLNTKACTHSRRDGQKNLTIYLGRKYYQEPDDAFVMTYEFATQRQDKYFSALITAEEGPLGTSDYRIQFEAMDIEGKTFGRIRVSQEHSWISSKAAKLYVATKGRNKPGISVIDRDEQGNPIYSSGERAIAERNLLRYYFAFAAFFHAQKQPKNNQFADSLIYWFDQTEQYKQLYELDRTQYIADKSKEHENQVTLQRLLEFEDRYAAKDR